MCNYWWKDSRDRNDNWQGLKLFVKESTTSPALEMVSGHHGRMALMCDKEPLFWASMLKDHSGAWLIFNAEHHAQQGLLPHVTSRDVEEAGRITQFKSAWWCRYFAERLLSGSTPFLASRNWLLRPMTFVPPSAPRALNAHTPLEKWRFHSPVNHRSYGFDWSLYGEDIPDLSNLNRITLVDWWWRGYLLSGRYDIDPQQGRMKWWRKKSREGTLPPVLVWFIAGLGSYVILDGHYRLQAAIEEGIPPEFIVLSEFEEREFRNNEEERQRIERSLLLQQSKNPDANLDGVNNMLINLYDTKYQFSPTHSRAILGKGELWEKEVCDYLRKQGLDDYIARILNRVSED